MIVTFGKIIAYIGLFITIVGLIFGFGIMFQDTNDELAKLFFMIIPFGFVLFFTGMSTVVLFSPRESELGNRSDLSKK
ncbi:MAG: hypothetical protein KAG28_06430 [Cocleimonas sp.]|nr:hypothetical protein [Cocleimonas sp.]